MYPPTYSLSQGFVNQFPKDYDGADMYMYSNTVLESVENSHLKNGHTCNYTFLIFFVIFSKQVKLFCYPANLQNRQELILFIVVLQALDIETKVSFHL